MRKQSSRLTPVDDGYETCERTLATLWIDCDARDPDFVTSYLGVEPTEVQKKGEIKQNSRGYKRTIKKSAWFLSSDGKVDSKDVRRHIDWLIAQLTPVKSKLLELQNLEGIVMSVNCIWWSATGGGGPTLWPEQMQGLADLNLECGFDVSFFEGR